MERHPADDDIVEDQPLHPAPPRRKVALAVVGLAAFGFSLPLVRTLGTAPEFFVAHRAGRAGTLVFWAVVVLAVPGCLGLLALLPGPSGESLRTTLLAVLGALAAASVLQVVSAHPLLFLTGIVASAIAVPYAARRSPPFLDVLAVSSVGCLLLTGFVVGPSRTGAYLRAGQAEEVAIRATDDLPPVVVIVFDEFPVSSLLGSDLRINEERFPNFAALADTSDWYRLASSVSPNTAYSVPALLSGQEPAPGAVPVASAYPANLFLQLASLYEVHAFESLTALCPPSICGSGASGAGSADPVGASGAGLLASDAWVVFRHAIGTDNMRASLPSISDSWDSFERATVVASVTSDGDGVVPAPVFSDSTFDREADALERLVESPARTDRPQLTVAHLTAPHAPWTMLPDGTTYGATDLAGSQVVDGNLHWLDGEGPRRTGYQRMLLQVGALDRVLGRVRASLERSGTWDDAVVVITADHGTQFEPGYFRDERAGGAEVTGVPLFIKAPHQVKGSIDDRPALTIDLVPTVLGLAGVRSPSRFDGVDLVHDDVPARRSDAFVVRSGDPVTPDQTEAALRRVVERRRSWIDPDAGWAAAFQPGVPDPVVGRSTVDVGRTAAPEGRWTRAAGETGGRVSLDLTTTGLRAETILVSCTGRVVGAGTVDAPGTSTRLQLFTRAGDCPADQLTVSYLDEQGGRHDLGPSR